jgi:hypothetical protein
MSLRWVWIAIFLGCLIGAGCSRGTSTPTLQGGLKMKLIISSTALVDGGTIPTRNTCDGEDLSPL